MAIHTQSTAMSAEHNQTQMPLKETILTFFFGVDRNFFKSFAVDVRRAEKHRSSEWLNNSGKKALIKCVESFYLLFFFFDFCAGRQLRSKMRSRRYFAFDRIANFMK